MTSQWIICADVRPSCKQDVIYYLGLHQCPLLWITTVKDPDTLGDERTPIISNTRLVFQASLYQILA